MATTRRILQTIVLALIAGFFVGAAGQMARPLDAPLGDCFQLRAEYVKEPVNLVKGARMHWPLADMPILVLVDPSAEDLLPATYTAATWWNEQLGMNVFNVSKEPSPIAAVFYERSPGVVPVGVLEVSEDQCTHDHPPQECYPRTEWEADAIGRMHQAPVIFPPFYRGSHPRTWWLMAHELGHVLGLRHTKKGQGVMWNHPDLTDLADSPRLPDQDRACLRAWYAKTSSSGSTARPN